MARVWTLGKPCGVARAHYYARSHTIKALRVHLPRRWPWSQTCQNRIPFIQTNKVPDYNGFDTLYTDNWPAKSLNQLRDGRDRTTRADCSSI